MNNNLHFWSHLAHFFLEWEIFQIEGVEKIKTIFMFKIFFLSRAIYEMMWKNIVEQGRLQMTMQRMRIACWIPKATNIHAHYVILFAFQLL
jgi:hypothetical protein